MSDSWATFGADLHLDLGARGGGPGREGDSDGAGGRAAYGTRTALMDAVRDAIRTGRLTPGTRLPSSRSLAADLGLARNTVAGAYAELVAEGWLAAQQGSGTRVAHRAEPAPPRGPGLRPHTHPQLPGQARWKQRPAHDLRTGAPDVSAFPRSAWLTSARRALTTAPARAFAHGDHRGTTELRRALADYLARARGVRADPERIVICAGFSQGLALLARVLGGDVAVEEYGLSFHRDLLEAPGVRTHPLPLDGHGARTTCLEATGPEATGPDATDPDVSDGTVPAAAAHLADVRAVLLTPGHQYPTGVPLHPDRRAAVVTWASRTGGLVLEDDYDGEFRYDRQPVGALQGLDPDRVVYLGTSSKALAPALRLAWMVLPDHLVDALLAAKTPAEWTTGALDQLTLADFLERGAYDRHVRAMRTRYRERRDRLVSTLAARAPGVRATGIAAGLHAVLELPPGAEEAAVLSAARRRGVALDALSDFRHPQAPPLPVPRPALVVGYGAPAEHAYPAALEALCGALADGGAGAG
ncbi:PLP-dependent aminotransferase family protein [Streptomyces sp. NBC_01775]|uniref:MocR-like pyridoxine biosynthesis transcription factor PdxR n=1 Tax=Streptomyces sp. NBC_01775 TaxID=2975939 RepID=UPI002DDAC995|nr:PLP-dependent aminotransferase family protein [Streptomyces sp. NBC_01775]WSB77208.1 PLP-dependent aminotransferase family protein [Streptomyces sp. NBC_01775]